MRTLLWHAIVGVLIFPMVFSMKKSASVVDQSDLQQAVEYDMKKLMEDVKKEIENELKEKTANGATSQRYTGRKSTPFSRAMEDRNNVFRKAHGFLVNEGLSHTEARKLVKEQLRDESHRHINFAGGENGRGREVVLINDSCDGTTPTCNETAVFRTISGQCNNLKKGQELWGSMTIQMRRELHGIDDLFQIGTYNDLLPSVSDRQGYGEGGGSEEEGTVATCEDCSFENFGVQRKGCSKSCGDGECGSDIDDADVALPNARLVSAVFHSDSDIPDSKATHMVTQWGQFLDHDITLTPETHVENCCDSTVQDDHCLPINIPSVDSFYGDRTVPVRCLEFTRSTGFCEEDEDEDHERAERHHEQINAITAFVDASNVYGSDDDSSDELRANDGTGKLKVGDNNTLPILPVDDEIEEEVAGDIRAREMPGLAAMHTLFVREHNRLCDLLKSKYPTKDEDFYFENARRILIAEMQNIVYSEYLPVVLGENAMKEGKLELSKNSKYDDTVDPSILNSFATAAYRFGHSMIQGIIQMYTEAGNYQEEYPLHENYFNFDKYYDEEALGMEKILMGLVTQKAQTNDRFVTEEVTNLLFPEDGDDFGSDLVARNIQRSRDHGLPSYVAFYDHYFPKDKKDDKKDNEEMDCWGNKPEWISQANWDLLSKIYQHPHHIELFVGGLAEDPVSGGLTGKLFNAIKVRQFKSLIDGDRFFFTHKDQPGSFTEDAQEEIMQRKLSDILCQNTVLEKIPQNAFQIHDEKENRYKDCSKSVRELDLTKINLLS